MERKQQIRKQHLSERSALSESVAEQLSAQISAYCREYLTGQNNLREHGVYGYYPLKKEVSLLHLYAWLSAEHVPLAFPRVCGDTMEFYQITSMEDFSYYGATDEMPGGRFSEGILFCPRKCI